MIKRPDTRGQRIKRHNRVRGKISGTAERPRLCVFRSESNIYAQIIDDVAGNTLVSASTVEKATAATAKPQRRSVQPSQSALCRRASKKSCSTAAATFITAA